QLTETFLEYALSYHLTIRLSDDSEYHYDENNLKNYYRDVVGRTDFQLNFRTLDELNATAETYREYLLRTTGGTLVSESIIPTIQPQVSVIIIDQATGEVKAVCGGRGDKEEIGSLVLNRATDSLRQPGSTFKPLVTYAPAIDICKDTLASTYYDSPLVIGDKNVRNWWGNDYLGYANIRFGIMASMNVLAVRCMENTVTENTAYAFAQEFGITSLVPQDKSYALTLGGLTYGVTNEELTAAYAAIANSGVWQKPIYWTRVTDENGKILMENSSVTRRIIRSSTAKLLTSAMESAVSPEFQLWPHYGVNATSTACQVEGMAIAGKSGTTNDANDLWFVGYSPYYTCGIWSGYDSSKSFGSSPGYHRVIWQRIMAGIHEKLELEEASFDYSGLEKALICSKSGLLAREGVCDACGDPNCHVYEEYFAPGTAPVEYCDRHITYPVCTVSDLPAGEFCPEELVEQHIFLMISPEDNDGSVTDDTKYTISPDTLAITCNVHIEAPTEPEPETETAESTEESSSDEEEGTVSGETEP
ncbi:MAG: penicillin-binding protein, partial [Lachnospiraceae bacterium]|nr:penicillin-binding protein [Lachnospiraceae bacterium]